ncbi:hypothetical protein P12x_005308 [Tundrisphaera lichenicola]|uniref:hypothetical protein n=1 Tax=Tundrisphaera lichenicola TaxID=2029860 RepID=UPI003EC0DE1D
MKVMGATKDGFLVECSEKEFCHLLGIDPDAYGVEGERTRETLRHKNKSEPPRKKIDWVGLNLPVSDLYKSARKIAEGWNEKYEFKTAVGFLRQFAEQLEMLAGTYRPVKSDDAP